MELAQKKVRELQGGYVVYAGGKLAAQTALPIGGIFIGSADVCSGRTAGAGAKGYGRSGL